MLYGGVEKLAFGCWLFLLYSLSRGWNSRKKSSIEILILLLYIPIFCGK